MSSSRNGELIAVIGGMGAAAGVKLQELVVQRRRAKRDRDHVPLLCYTNPSVPPRIGERGHECVGEIVRSIKAMEMAGATRFVMACNTAHIFAKEIEASVNIPMLSLIECTAAKAVKELGSGTSIGLLATSSLIESQLFQKTFEQMSPGVKVLTLEKNDQQKLDQLIQGQDGLKGGNLGPPVRDLAKSLAMSLVERGAAVVITGCTELPLVLSEETCPQFPVKLLEPMAIVADEIIRLNVSKDPNSHS